MMHFIIIIINCSGNKIKDSLKVPIDCASLARIQIKCASLFPSCVKAMYVGPYGTIWDQSGPKNVQIRARLARSIAL